MPEGRAAIKMPHKKRRCRRILGVLRLVVGVRNAANKSGYMRTREFPTERPLYPRPCQSASCRLPVDKMQRCQAAFSNDLLRQTQENAVKLVAHKTSLVT